MRRSTRHTFAAAVALGLVVIPVASVIAVFLASGSGTVSGAQITTSSPSSVRIDAAAAPGSEFVYEGPSTTALAPGGDVKMSLAVTCLTSCPATVGSIRLVSVSSNQSGCSSAALPGTFTSPGLAVNTTITGTVIVGQLTVFMNSTGDDQTPCLGATLTFNLATP